MRGTFPREEDAHLLNEDLTFRERDDGGFAAGAGR
jgi:hypothetical protein